MADYGSDQLDAELKVKVDPTFLAVEYWYARVRTVINAPAFCKSKEEQRLLRSFESFLASFGAGQCYRDRELPTEADLDAVMEEMLIKAMTSGAGPTVSSDTATPEEGLTPTHSAPLYSDKEN